MASLAAGAAVFHNVGKSASPPPTALSSSTEGPFRCLVCDGDCFLKLPRQGLGAPPLQAPLFHVESLGPDQFQEIQSELGDQFSLQQVFAINNPFLAEQFRARRSMTAVLRGKEHVNERTVFHVSRADPYLISQFVSLFL